MTDFEKALLKHTIETSKEINKSIRSILGAVGSEECNHFGDKAETKIVKIIGEHLTSVSDGIISESVIDKIMEEHIISLVQNNDYDSIIKIIEDFEEVARKMNEMSKRYLEEEK